MYALTARLREYPEIERVLDTRVVPNIRSGGIGFYENNTGETLQLQAFSTHVLNRAGQHQIRYGVALLPYDLTWNVVAAVLVILGVVLTVRSRGPRRAEA